MLEVKLRHVSDQELIEVNLGALALSVRGDFRFPARENGGPAVIVRCADRRDVLECLEFASRLGVLVAMYNAHEDPATWSDCDQGIAVDLSALSARAARHTTRSYPHFQDVTPAPARSVS